MSKIINAALSQSLGLFANEAREPEEFANVSAGRASLKVRAKNAATVAKRIKTAHLTYPRGRNDKMKQARNFPTFKPGMSTREYVHLFKTMNQGSALSANILPYALDSLNAAPCTLYEGGALDFDVIEETNEDHAAQAVAQVIAVATTAAIIEAAQSTTTDKALSQGMAIACTLRDNINATTTDNASRARMYLSQAARISKASEAMSHRAGHAQISEAYQHASDILSAWGQTTTAPRELATVGGDNGHACSHTPTSTASTAPFGQAASTGGHTPKVVQKQSITLQTAPEKMMQHGRDWDGRDVTGWHFSEKMDGCRAFWDGATLYTKSGNVINAPSITNHLPSGFPLDGEIWAGRGNFETARLFVQYGKQSPAVEFVAFDAPGVSGDWPERMAAARAKNIKCVPAFDVQNMSDAESLMNAILAAGGEGLMVRRPDHGYTPGRSSNMLKIKAHNAQYFYESSAEDLAASPLDSPIPPTNPATRPDCGQATGPGTPSKSNPEPSTGQAQPPAPPLQKQSTTLQPDNSGPPDIFDMAHPDNITGAELQTLREACGLSRDELAQLVGVQARTVKHWENGRAGVPGDVALMVTNIDNMIEQATEHARQAIVLAHAANTLGDVVLLRYQTDQHLHTYRPDMATMPASVHSAIIARVRAIVRSMPHGNAQPRPVRVVWMQPDIYEPWRTACHLPDSETTRSQWAAQQVPIQAIPHRGDQPPA